MLMSSTNDYDSASSVAVLPNASHLGILNRRPQRQPPAIPTDAAIPSTFSSSTSTIGFEQINPDLQSSEPTNENDVHSQKPSALLFEFDKLFQNFDFESIREDILERRLSDSNFATVLWRIFLHCLPRDPSQWSQILEMSRKKYETLVNQYRIDPHSMKVDHGNDKVLDHPLSQEKNSFWAQYFAAEALREAITLDVRRTYPEISFFRDPNIINLQVHILYTYSCHHEKTLPYRQGMHEILGMIVYCLFMEGSQVNECRDANSLMKTLYDYQYLEHDAYDIFEKIMDHLRTFYIQESTDNTVQQKKAPDDSKKGKLYHSPRSTRNEKQSVERIQEIFNRCSNYDRLLVCKLKTWDIESTVFGTRWVRLLFMREMPFESIPSLWTIIFCFDERFGFVDYFFIALLIQFGKIVQEQPNVEMHEFLQILLQQNYIRDSELIIRGALGLVGRSQGNPRKDIEILPIRRLPSEMDKQNKEKKIENDTANGHKLQRVRVPPSNTRSNRQIFTNQYQFSSAPANNFTVDAAKNSSVKGKYQEIMLEMATEISSVKTFRELYDERIQVQKSCSHYMCQLLDHLQILICKLEASNEKELLVQLGGLKQIARILDGTLAYDPTVLEYLLSDAKEKSIAEKNSNSTS